MADINGARTMLIGKGVADPGRNILGLRAAVLSLGGPDMRDLLALYAWILGYSGATPPPATGGGDGE